MNLLFIIVYAIWLSSEVLLGRLVRSNKSDKQHADQNTLRFIWVMVFASTFAAGFVYKQTYAPIGDENIVPYIGLILVLLGVVLRFSVIRSLGRLFTVDITIREGHHIKKDGFYKFIRHPSYTFALMSFTGYGISLNNWISLAIVLVLILIAFLRRIRVEEAVLTEQFGEEYIAYKKHTKRLIPFIY